MTQTSTASSFCHIDIPAPDLAKAKAFYETVFGWTVEVNTPAPKYWFFRSGNIGGAFNARSTPSGNGVVLLLKVDDMDATLERITAHGGTVTRGRSRIGEADTGEDAYFLDPNGNALGLYAD